MSGLRAAVIGCGRITSAYLPALKNIGSETVEPVLAMDKQLDRAEKFAKNFPGCAVSDMTDLTSFKNLLREYHPDILHILLPHHLHREYAVAALESDVNVLMEKPIGISLKDADDIIDASKKSKRQLGIIFQNRYIDGVERVRSLIQDGTLGAVKGAFSTLAWHRPPSYYECDWKGNWQTEGGGVVIDQAIHSIDLIRFMTGMDAVKVQGHIARRVLETIEVEDEADAAITLENGAVYSFFACNYYTKNSPIRVEIHCENGTALLTADQMDISWVNGENETILPSLASISAGGESYWGAFHEKQLRSCYEALAKGESMPWSPEDAKKTLEIVLGIYLSARINDTITI
ncbi:Gfo/Idh/MocA family oxidoreductase [Lachnospiraceae bacterium 54-53]